MERYLGCLLGLACGDAVGTTVEFSARGTFPPVADMVGGGPFQLQPGQWTDDTSMALCLAYSLITKKSFDPIDQMNRYSNWYNFGYLSSTGSCFDIGSTVVNSINRYLKTKEPFSGSIDPMSSGNGAIMRLAPIPMFYANNPELAIKFSGESSRTTHGSEESIECARLFGLMIQLALTGSCKSDILTGNNYSSRLSKINSLSSGNYIDKPEIAIKGSGYVVESLEAALWCFANTESYKDAILKAVNLGDDADTTAAVCGQIAGAYYGISKIPSAWLEKLYMRDEISNLAKDLYLNRF